MSFFLITQSLKPYAQEKEAGQLIEQDNRCPTHPYYWFVPLYPIKAHDVSFIKDPN